MYIVEAILPLAHRKSQLKNRALCGQKKKILCNWKAGTALTGKKKVYIRNIVVLLQQISIMETRWLMNWEAGWDKLVIKENFNWEL